MLARDPSLEDPLVDAVDALEVALDHARARVQKNGTQCSAFVNHGSKVCESGRCNKLHYHVCQVVAMTRSELLANMNFASSNGMVNHLDRNPQVAVVQMLKFVDTMTCPPDCTCSCHECDEECTTQRALLAAMNAPEPPSAFSGVTWGLLLPQPEVLVPHGTPNGFRALWNDLIEAGTQISARGETQPYMTLIESGLIQSSRAVGIEPHVAERTTGVSFVAMEHLGERVEHQMLFGPSWSGIIARDFTDPNGASYIFPLRRREKTQNKLLAEIKRCEYLTFLCYLALRVVDPARRSFGEILSQPESSSSRRTFIEEVQNYAKVALHTSGKARYVTKCIKPCRNAKCKSRLARTSGDTEKHERRICKLSNDTASLNPRERVFTGVVDATVAEQQAEYRRSIKSQARKFQSRIIFDSFMLCARASDARMHETLQRDLSLARQQSSLLEQRAYELLEQGRAREALDVVCGKERCGSMSTALVKQLDHLARLTR